MPFTAPLLFALAQGAQAAPVAAPAGPPASAPADPGASAPAAPPAASPSPDPFASATPPAAPPAPASPGVIYYPYGDPGPADQPSTDPFVTAYTDPSGERALRKSPAYRKLVLAGNFGLGFGVLDALPSIDANMFLGTDAPPRRSRKGRLWRAAFGYQVSLTLGRADHASLVFSEIPSSLEDQIFFHRHHLTVLGYGGPGERLFYSFGAGIWMNYASFRGVELEGRIGVRFAVRPDVRGSGVFGLQTRLTAAIDGIPLPQFGPFIGFLIF